MYEAIIAILIGLESSNKALGIEFFERHGNCSCNKKYI